ncbi:helix-turn-helix transcriptional regulator [Paenibacillus sp. MER 78]|uniref:helix-turn-helix domain-containing protein n=1 Tax=Paenibacillus sp. MER 78 TaxID=2939571 RepID=UPI00203EEF0D|nr:helix-turn-helix transcriptional regulator [Paenibacillus sp. MER 78]MCM3130987.1 helix-turn-helix transcriptional regulator [Paenibacillus sp. MER 78]
MDLIPVRCRIPDLLERKGKNQQWLAEKTGMRKQRISDIVHLRMDNISIKRAALIAYHLECRLDDLFEWEWR